VGLCCRVYELVVRVHYWKVCQRWRGIQKTSKISPVPHTCIIYVWSHFVGHLRTRSIILRFDWHLCKRRKYHDFGDHNSCNASQVAATKYLAFSNWRGTGSACAHCCYYRSLLQGWSKGQFSCRQFTVRNALEHKHIHRRHHRGQRMSDTSSAVRICRLPGLHTLRRE